MRQLFIAFLLTMSSQSFAAVENLEQFTERFQGQTCAAARTQAAERARDMVNGNGSYDGQVAAYKGKKVVRLIQIATGCESIYTDLGKQYWYWLTIQVQAN